MLQWSRRPCVCEIMTGVTSRSPPKVTHAIPGENKIFSLTSLDDYVYVMRAYRKEVEVYDAVTMTLERCLPVYGISSGVSGIAACSSNKCLYLSVWDKIRIHRVNLATKWRVAAKPRGLSVNGDNNVLVTCIMDKKLQEYTTEGRLVREICLPAGLGSPWHFIQLSTGDYVVSHWQSPGVVSVVGVDGRLVRDYEPSSSADVGPMKCPRSLAATKHGDIFVADQDNNRILAINSSLTRAQVFPLPDDVGLQRPFALYLDDTRDRLYIGEWSGEHRVIALSMRAGFLETLFFNLNFSHACTE